MNRQSNLAHYHVRFLKYFPCGPFVHRYEMYTIPVEEILEISVLVFQYVNNAFGFKKLIDYS